MNNNIPIWMTACANYAKWKLSASIRATSKEQGAKGAGARADELEAEIERIAAQHPEHSGPRYSYGKSLTYIIGAAFAAIAATVGIVWGAFKLAEKLVS